MTYVCIGGNQKPSQSSRKASDVRLESASGTSAKPKDPKIIPPQSNQLRQDLHQRPIPSDRLKRIRAAQDRFHAVVSKQSVNGKRNQTFGLGLSDEKPIEGISVIQWQLPYRQGMGCGISRETTFISLSNFAMKSIGGDGRAGFRIEYFLPISSSGEIESFRIRCEDFQNRGRKTIRFEYIPEQNIGIQEESHSALTLGFHSLERVLNFVWKRGIEIVGNLNLPFVLSAHPAARFMKRDHARYGHAPASDNDLLAFGKTRRGSGKTSLCLVGVHGSRGWTKSRCGRGILQTKFAMGG